MRAEVIETLERMPGAVITRVEASKDRVRLIAVSDTGTFAIVLTGGCGGGCDSCSCQTDKVGLTVEAV